MLETIIKGGSMMLPLMLQSVLAVAVAIDRWIAFARNDKVDSRSLRSKGGRCGSSPWAIAFARHASSRARRSARRLSA